MRRYLPLVAFVALLTVPLAASAEPAPKASKTQQAKGSKQAKPKQQPAIPVDKLRQEVSGQIKQGREQLEAAKKNAPAPKAASMRQQFEGAATNLRAKLASAVSDGVVTKDELKQVRGAYKLMASKPARGTTASKKAPSGPARKK